MTGNGRYQFIKCSYQLVIKIHAEAKAKAAAEGIPLNHIIQVLVKRWLDGDTKINYEGLKNSKMGRK